LGPQNVPRIDKESVLEVILGQEGSREMSSSANMAPRTDLDRFSIDVSLIGGGLFRLLQPNCASRIGGTGRKAFTIRRVVKVSQLLGVSGGCACKATLLHIHCTTSCTLPVKLWLKPHLKSQLT